MKVIRLKAAIWGIVFLQIPVALWAQDASPFERVRPVQANAVDPSAANYSQRLSQLEFTGYMSLGGKKSVNIYDGANQRSYWIELDTSEQGLQISEFNEQTGSVMISLNGERRRVSLNNVDIVEIKNYNSKPTKQVVAKSEKVKKDEEQARQMVSNLLVEGMERRKKREQERKARLEARRKSN